MNLLPKKMTNAKCRMGEKVHSPFALRHFEAPNHSAKAKIQFANHSTHGTPRRRSPGRKALFSSIHPAPASWTAAAGFTLIEVILALGVCSLVLVVISGVFGSALHLQETVSKDIDESLPVERALNLMRKDLKNAVAPGGMLAGPMQSGSLDGGVDAGDGIQIYTTTGLMSSTSPWGEIQKITYGLQSTGNADDGSKELVRSVTRNLLSTSVQDEDDQFLAKGIQKLTFSYYDGTDWLDTWDDTTQTNLPVAVRVRVQLAPKNSTQEAPQPIQMLVPLMVQVHTNELDNTESDTTTPAPGGN